MQRYLNAQEQIIKRTHNLLLDNLEFGSKIMMGIDYGTSGDETVMTVWKDHQLIESIVLTDTTFKICKSLLQKEIARKEIKKRLFYGASQFVRWTLTVWWWQNIQTLKKLWK